MNSKLVYLVQTDTTAGFLSSDDKKLAKIKNRPSSKKSLQAINSFKSLNTHIRVPKKFRKIVRNAARTTFIYPNKKAFRKIDTNSKHYSFIDKFGYLYSTSANLTGKNFNKDYAFKSAEVIVEDKNGFKEMSSSKIFKLGKNKIQKVR